MPRKAVPTLPGLPRQAEKPTADPRHCSSTEPWVRIARRVTETDQNLGVGAVLGGPTSQILSRATLFRGIPPHVLEQVAHALEQADVPTGAVIVQEGGQTDRFFIIQSGTLVATSTVSGQEREVSRLGAGDFFGELALMHQGTSAVTVRAETPARLLMMRANDFHTLTERIPELAYAVREAAQQRKAEHVASQLEVEHHNIANLLEKRGEIRIGRAINNDLVFTSPTVSRQHALIRLDNGRPRLSDLGSTAGTFVNGQDVRGTVDISDGDEITIGDHRLIFDRNQLTDVVEGGRLLQDVSLTVLPGELVAIVGGSGAGKTTLLDAMSGVRPATHGQVRYDGRDYYSEIAQYRHTLGYVPQDDIIHHEMPLRLTLTYAARLRLPKDTPSDAIDAAVEQGLVELGLTNQADLRVGALSGGQRKRASIGIELLTEPRIFYLDEPTSGLDPSTDRQLMQLLRRLANGGRTIVLTTHATANVKLCDKICVMAREGHLAFFGTPDDALRYFGVSSFDEIYDRIAGDASPREWGDHWKGRPEHAAIEAGQTAPRPMAKPARGGRRGRGLPHALHQFRVLSKRNFDLYARHPSSFVPLIMQPVVFTILLLALFRTGLFENDTRNPNAPLQLVYTFAFMVFLFGLLFGVQEIVKERAIFLRERQVNVGVVPYLLSKTSFLGPLLVVCTIAMTAILWATDRLPDAGFDVYGPLVLTLSLTAFAGLALALFISALVNNSQLATDLLTPWIAPQVLFAGALFAVPSMNFIGKGIAAITAVRWSFESTVAITDLKDLFAASPSPVGEALLVQYKDSFNSGWGTYCLILTLFIIVPLVGAAIALSKKSQPR